MPRLKAGRAYLRDDRKEVAMRTDLLTNPKEAVECSPWATHPPSSIDKEELDLLAFELWQRGSCPEMAADEIWLDAEESVLMPH
jgi:hypothetical protein